MGISTVLYIEITIFFPFDLSITIHDKSNLQIFSPCLLLLVMTNLMCVTLKITFQYLVVRSPCMSCANLSSKLVFLLGIKPLSPSLQPDRKLIELPGPQWQICGHAFFQSFNVTIMVKVIVETNWSGISEVVFQFRVDLQISLLSKYHYRMLKTK